MSKKLARLQYTTGGAKGPRKRRRVRAFVARGAARDFYRIILLLGIIGIIFNWVQTYAFLD
ncbi:hypothetical protein ADL19_08105 [Streptomyces purpurogeneiscleroticus]|jgi:hypothetical protein|nr:hypothetical protein ADL19_08105 [Streptomyces purpurogeneiscleroticus]